MCANHCVSFLSSYFSSCLPSFFQFYLPSFLPFPSSSFLGGVVVAKTVYNTGMYSKLKDIILLFYGVNLCCFSIRNDGFGQTYPYTVMGLVNTASQKSYTHQHSVLTIKASFSKLLVRVRTVEVHRKIVKIGENSYVPHISSP